MKPELQETGIFSIGDRALAYTVSRSARRRRTVAFSLEEPGKIRILAPLRTNIRIIEKIIQTRAGWLHRRMQQLQHQDSPRTRIFVSGETVSYLGKSYVLQIDHGHRPSCRMEDGQIRLTLNTDNPDAKNLREEARLELLLWYKKQARQEFKQRADMWAEKIGVRYRKLIVSNPRHLWGSCSPDNTIRISWRLILAPPELLDYVIAHELCHVPHKNHSARFWRCLEKVMPDYKTRRKTLRENGLRFTI